LAEDTEALVKTVDAIKEREKPRLVSLLFFDFINETKDRKMNLIGVFDRVYVDPEVKRTHPFGIFCRVGHAFTDPLQVTIFDPSGELTGGLMFDFSKEDFDGQGYEGKKPSQIQFMGQIQFNTATEGAYWFDVSYQGQSLGGTQLLVEFKDLKEEGHERTRGDA
jgi:hypothetical protein